MPDLPTAHEQGLVDFDVVHLECLFLPKGAPAESRHEAQRRDEPGNGHSGDEEPDARYRDYGRRNERRSPEYLAKFVVDEIRKMGGPN